VWVLELKRRSMAVGSLVAPGLIRRLRAARATREQREYGALDLEEAFGRIYREQHWVISSAPQPRSGSGSAGAAADRYVEVVASVLRDARCSEVVDVGCGDLAIADRLDLGTCRYLGLDVVPHLIDEHRRRDPDPQRRYACVDVTSEPLPRADCYLIRQVLQHLSNTEIAAVLERLPAGSCVVITESAPLGGVESPNVDVPHGPHTRLPHGSAVQLDREPFNVSGGVELLRVTTEHEQIVTTIYRSWPGRAAGS
jgi:hypothetical protein